MEITITQKPDSVEIHLDYKGKYLPVLGSIGRGKTIAEALIGLAVEVEGVETNGKFLHDVKRGVDMILEQFDRNKVKINS